MTTESGAPAHPLLVAPVPLNLPWKDPRAALAAIDDSLSALPARGAEPVLAVFPELTLTGFVTDHPETVALSRSDAVITDLTALSAGHGVGIVAGFPESNPADGNRPWNTTVLIDPDDGILASYRKIHLFPAGNPPESQTYSPGLSATLVDWRGWRIGFAVCFDLRFPYLFSACAREGADLMVVPSCWVGGPEKSGQFQALNRGHAVLGQCYVAGVNRSGADPNVCYSGDVAIYSPAGVKLGERGLIRLDPLELKETRRLDVWSGRVEPCPVRIKNGSGK